ncbi:MAG: YfhO family protein, partial [Bradymonadaceae bacterium]
LPWMTVLVFVGIVLTVLRDECAFDRWLWALGGVTLLLFMGRTNLGGWYDLLPMHGQINVMRYTAGLHFCGLLAAAVAGRRIVGWGGRKLADGLVADRKAIAAAVCVTVACGIYGYDRYRFFEGALSTFDHRHPNVTALVDHLADGDGTRFAVDDQLHTSPHFYRDLLPALAGRGQLQSYALGYHATLSTYYADYLQFDRTWARLFNVGAFVAREPYQRSIVEGLEQTHDRGPYQVFAPPGGADWGYFDFIRTPAVVEGGYHAIRPAVRRLLVPGFESRVLPVVRGPTPRSEQAGAPVLRSRSSEASVTWSIDDRREWVDLLKTSGPDRPITSSVVSASRGKNWYAAEVEAAGGSERLMLKVNYFPFWRATVDGESVAIDHVAPNFMAIDVPAGRHHVRFTYRNPWWQKAGGILTLLFLMGWGLRRWQTFRR